MQILTKKRFEELVALHIEGSASVREENELRQALKLQPTYHDTFLQARRMDYLLKAFFDEAVSEKHFTRRVLIAMHPDRLSDKAFVAAVMKKRPEPEPFKRERFFSKSVWKVAASVILAFGCIGLLQKYFSPSVFRQTEVAQVSQKYLAWDVDTEISTLENQMAAHERPGHAVVYSHPQVQGDMVERIRRMNKQIKQMREGWNHPAADLIEEKNGESI